MYFLASSGTKLRQFFSCFDSKPIESRNFTNRKQNIINLVRLFTFQVRNLLEVFLRSKLERSDVSVAKVQLASLQSPTLFALNRNRPTCDHLFVSRCIQAYMYRVGIFMEGVNSVTPCRNDVVYTPGSFTFTCGVIKLKYGTTWNVRSQNTNRKEFRKTLSRIIIISNLLKCY